MMTDELSLYITGRGSYRVTAGAFDRAMRRYLPASPADLRTTCEELWPEEDYSQVHTVTEFLMILAVHTEP